jgi:hypothetical protein
MFPAEDKIRLNPAAAADRLIKNIIGHFICCNKRHSGEVQRILLARLLVLCTIPAQPEKGKGGRKNGKAY